MYLDQLGMQAESAEQKMAILMAVKDKSFEKSGLLTVEEFAEVATRVMDEG